MTYQEAIEMFPVAIKVTKLMIERADIDDTRKCIGARALRKAFDSRTVEWGVTTGSFEVEGKIVKVYSSNEEGECLDMMRIKKPTTVILTLDKPKEFSLVDGVNTPKSYKV